jgi:hypothetical protein
MQARIGELFDATITAAMGLASMRRGRCDGRRRGAPHLPQNRRCTGIAAAVSGRSRVAAPSFHRWRPSPATA